MKKEVKVNMKIPDDLQPAYVNMVNISFKPDEFCIAFAHTYPVWNGLRGMVKAVISMTPQYAKLLAKVLEENIKKYEGNFGEIKLPGDKTQKNLTYRA